MNRVSTGVAVQPELRMNRNMRHFAFQKVAFREPKGHLLQAKRRPFVSMLIISRLQTCLLRGADGVSCDDENGPFRGAVVAHAYSNSCRNAVCSGCRKRPAAYGRAVYASANP